MGSIVSFMPRPTPPKRAERVAGSVAEIVIFPGVRYERQPEQEGAIPFQLVQPAAQMPLR